MISLRAIKDLAAAADVNMREIGGPTEEVARDPESVLPGGPEGRFDLLRMALQPRPNCPPRTGLAATKRRLQSPWNSWVSSHGQPPRKCPQID